MPLKVTLEEFAAIAAENRDLQLERTAAGELLVNPPSGSESDRRNTDITIDLGLWTRQHGGVSFGPSAGFVLPNGALRSPDVAWIASERYEALMPEQKEGFAPICPDFAIELRSPSDRLAELQAKMREYIDNGLRLGWLIDPHNRRVEIYRPDRNVESLEQPAELTGEDVLSGFVLPLTRIWQ
ncbi:Uma2 family endonuclease [Rubidibacter lacunae]|nr:Uma2 family endonuclease [Rubidibacter lacunae]